VGTDDVKAFCRTDRFCRLVSSAWQFFFPFPCSLGDSIAENVIRLLLYFSVHQLLLQLKWNLLHVTRWPLEGTLLFLKHLKISSRNQNVCKFWNFLTVACFKCFLIFILLAVLGFELGFTLASQELCHMSHTPSNANFNYVVICLKSVRHVNFF
jgi:hypothetical protein